MTNEELILEAQKARMHAYAPYSHFQVGAALLTKGGQVYLGCNIENAAYSPSNCAERTAFYKAVYEGEREFTKIAIVGGPENEDAHVPCAPCGVCRQVMVEFCEPDFQIILTDGKDSYKQIELKDLIPFSFGPENLQ